MWRGWTAARTRRPEEAMTETPAATGSLGARTKLRKRFYTSVEISAEPEGHAIRLEGRAARTPAGGDLVLPTPALATAVAAEWAAQGARIDPATMPLTR